jgi:RNA polymerase sigma factor (sigma-70 family)
LHLRYIEQTEWFMFLVKSRLTPSSASAESENAQTESENAQTLEAIHPRWNEKAGVDGCDMLPLRNGGAKETDDDVLQEISLGIFQNLRYLRHPGAFRPWAFRLASRRAFRYLKRETRWKLLETDPDVISSLPAPEAVPEALEPGLLAVIEQISPASRAVLLLHYQHDLSIEETAIVLEIPVGTAKSRLAYGVSVLRKLINQKGT